MRIIAGEFRGRKLLGPESETTRPITDRAKQSLFDVLAPLMPQAEVYDCFAGTGSMGLESLSRSAVRAVFFEADRSAASRLRQNIRTLKVENRACVVEGDLFSWFGRRAMGEPKIDLIFLDPPYRFLKERSAELAELAGRLAKGHLRREGTVIFRHDEQDALKLPGLLTYDTRTYGRMMIELMRLT